MDQQCYNQGSCTLCGCHTTALQCANKACDKPCYPMMMNKNLWNRFRGGEEMTDGIYEWQIIISDEAGCPSELSRYHTQTDRTKYTSIISK